MPRKQKQAQRPKEEYTLIVVQVESHEASMEVCVNRDVYAPQYAFRPGDEEPLVEFKTRLTVIGTSIVPKRRAGETYELTVYGDDSPSHKHDATLASAQVRNEYGSPQYRSYRGRQIPIYRPPGGLGVLHKVTGEPRWSLWTFVPTRFATDTILLLGRRSPLYLNIHERKEGRTRWVRSISLETTPPDED